MPSKKPSREEYRQKLEALEKRNAELASICRDPGSLLENLTDIIYVLDPNGRVTYVSPNLERIAGYRPEDIIGLYYWDFLFREDMENHYQYFSKAVSGHEISIEHQYVSGNGNVIWCINNARPVYEKSNRVIGVQGVLTDITERKKYEDALKKSEEEFQAIFDSTEDIAFLKNRDLRYVKVNTAMEILLGKSCDELLGRRDFEIFGAKEAFYMDAGDRRVFCGETVNEEDLIQINDKKLLFQVKKTPVYNKDGEISGLCGIARDITEQKRKENELRILAEMLDSAPSSITVHDFEGRFLYANQKTFDLHGYEPDEFMGVNLYDLDVPDSSFLIGDRLDCVDENREARFEVEHYRKDGSVFPLQVLAKIINWKEQRAVLSIAEDISEQKQAEKSVQAVLEQQQVILDCSMVGIMLLHNRIITKVNNRMAEILGYIPAQIEGLSPEKLHLSQENYLDFGEKYYWRLAEQNIVQVEYPMRHKNGEVVWCLFSGSALSPPDLSRGAVWSVDDITDRRKAQETLLESERQKNLILNSTSEMFLYYDLDLRVIWANRAASEMVGIIPESMAGRYCYEILYQRSEPCPGCPVLQAKNKCIPQQIETQTPDGRYWNIRGYPVIDSKGSVISLLEVIQDITEHKEFETALQESERQKDLILNTSAEKVVYFSPDLRIIWANRASAIVSGISESEIVGRYCYEIWQQRNDPCPECAVQNARDKKSFQQGETLSLNGICWSVRAYPVFDDSGNVEAMVSFGQDITARKKAEEEKKWLQEQFQQAQKMESVGRLAGGVAHDLNNLLSPILGYGEMLLEDAPDNDPRKQEIEEIVSAGRRAQGLVRQLLAFSRKQALQFHTVNINDVIKNFKKLLRRTIREDIKIHTRLSKSVSQVRGDIGQLEQVIMNLAVNSQDAMIEGGKLTIETSEVELDEAYAKQKNGVTPGNYAMMAIGDTGTGMDEETLEHLFEPFFTTKEKGRGTGLGMSTAYGIVKQHGGNIWVYSEAGIGSTVKIYLPVISEVPGAEGKIEHEKKESKTKGFETVLLVEDDQQVSKIASTILKRDGYNVLEAGNGEDAITIFDNHQGQIHLLFTDVVMPDMNGKQLYERISEINPYIKVLFMSGYTDEIINHNGVINPEFNFIEKLFSKKTLAAKVRDVLAQ